MFYSLFSAFLICLILGLPESGLTSESDTLTFVFDLDSTLIETIGYKKITIEEFAEYETHKKVTKDILENVQFKFLDFRKAGHLENPHFLNQIIEVKEIIKGDYYLTYYRIVDWTAELVEYLLSLPFKVELFAFSGSSELRNQQALEKIPLVDGPLISKIKDYYSAQHLNLVPKNDRPPSPRFADKFKKDMKIISRDLKNVILIDDYHGFVPDHQKNNQLTLFGVTWHFEDYSDKEHFYEKNKMMRVPQNQKAQFVARNKLAYVQGIVDAAVKIYQQEGRSKGFAEIVYELSRHSSESIVLLPPAQIERREEYQYIKKGLEYFKARPTRCAKLFEWI